MNWHSAADVERQVSMDSITPRALSMLGGQVQILNGPIPDNSDPTRIPPLRRMWRTALRRRWLLVGALAGGMLLAIVISLLMTKQYSATSRLQISRETSRVIKIDSVERDTSIGDQEFYQTQYGLLQATGLAERVAADLRLVDDPAFFRMFGRDDLFEADALPLSDPTRRAKRQEVAGKILLDHVGISPVRGSSLVDISAMTPDPALSQRIAQAWSKNFIESNLERRFEASDYARKFLESRIQQLREKVEESERQAVAYASRVGIINLPMPGTKDENGNVVGADRSLVTDDLAALNNALALATAERIGAGARIASLRRADASEEAITNQAISLLRQKRAEIAADYAEQSSQFTPQYPPVKALADQLAEIDTSIRTEEARIRAAIVQSYDTAAARENALHKRVEALKSDFTDLRRRSIQYTIYQREAETNRDLYNSLLQRYKEIGIAGAIENNNVAVINAAKLPDRPSRPNLVINLLLGLLAGGVIGIVLVASLEQIDEGISDPSEVQEKLGLPLLGAVPIVAGEDPVSAMSHPRSPLVEAYLAVQTNLELSTSQGVPRSLAITSSRPREGKSTTAMALAQSLARSNRNVVLVDADMRAPSVHSAFNISNDAGVSNYLAGADNLAHAVQPSDKPHLSLMPAGPPPPNAAELLTGPAFQKLITHLLDQFDHVIIDAPPVVGLADAALIGATVGGVVFVIEARSMQVGQARNALRRLAMAKANMVGAILTKFDANRSRLGHDHAFDYYYGYGRDAA